MYQKIKHSWDTHHIEKNSGSLSTFQELEQSHSNTSDAAT